MNRRDFLFSTGCLVAGVAGVSCCGTRRSAASASTPARRIAFNSANLVGRVSNYRYELTHWGEQHQKTIAATDEKAWRAICAEIAKAGYSAIEVWEAHAAPESLDAAKAKTWRKILDDAGLQPIGYGGSFRPETVKVCQWLGIPVINGGLRGLTAQAATALCRESGVRFNHENHPEKSVAEILRAIEGGNEWLGICVDTGWLGTQGVAAPEAIQALGAMVRHTHIKDVRRAGGHETCRLGDGMVRIPAVLATLKKMNYTGWFSWEDEPEDRNPMDLAPWTLDYLRQQLS